MDKNRRSTNLIQGLLVILTTVVWASSALFGFYILAFYVTAFVDGDLSAWNNVLPGLYEQNAPVATVSIGLHFAAGGIILILGSIQLIASARTRYPKMHRWIGRIYVIASLFTAIGGLLFIAINGTIGGLVMDIGFGIYGLLVWVSAVETMRHARAGRLTRHRAWSWRLYALAIGSWLYRMEYGFWILMVGSIGITTTLDGWFDSIMAFFFYIPNLIIVELLLRTQKRPNSVALNIIASAIMLSAIVFLGVATYAFTDLIWWSAIAPFIGME